MSEQHSKRIIVVGNSGFARECYIVLREIMKKSPSITFGGFLSFEGYKADLLELSSYFLGIDDEYTFAEGEYAVIGIGDPALRRKAYLKLQARSVPFYTLIHPNVYIDPSATVGEGNIFTTGCYVACNCSIGDGNLLNGNVHLGHDVRVGNFNFIGPLAQLTGATSIGDANSIGTLCVLLPRCTIGSGNIIAPMSAVFKGCRDNAYIAGNPALKVGNVN